MTTALIDGDMIAYMGAMLAETEAFPPIDGEDQAPPLADWPGCRRIMNDIMDKWEYLAGASDRRIALTDRSKPRASFRYQVHPHYKNQRTSAKPAMLEKAEAYLVKKHGAESRPGLEGDDLLGIWATGMYKGEGVIVSKDKDMRTIPGQCIIIPHMKSTDDLVPEKITKRQALDNLFVQTLQGDVVDNYLGAPGIGEKGAAKWLETMRDKELNRWDTILDAYEWAWENRPRYRDKWVHPGDPVKEALMNMRCARLLVDGDYKYNKGVRLWGPKGEDEWLSL